MATEADDLKVQEENEKVRALKGDYKYGWHDKTNYTEVPEKGVSHAVIDMMSDRKGEPDWMRKFRHKSLDVFYRKPMPTWGADLSGIDFDDIYYYIKPMSKVSDWDDMPEDIKATWDKLGIPEAEKNYLGGVTLQYESESVYHKTKIELERQGIIFTDMDTALREHPDIVKQYFGTIIPPADNKFSALNSAVWSGGSFIYVPPGVEVEIPLQAYFRINQENMGQFERTLIIVDEGAKVHYVEGCSAPIYSSDSLHSAVVEIIIKKDGHCRYTTIQNWSNNVYNLVTKRAAAYQGAVMEWVDGNLGCIAQGERVATPGGLKAIEDVSAGDEVMSYEENSGEFVFRKVLGKTFSGMQPVRTVAHGARKVRVTDNHPFLSYTYDGDRPKKLGRYDLAWVRADALKEAIFPTTALDFGNSHPLEVSARVTETTFETSNQYAGELTATRTRRSRLRLPQHSNADVMWLFGYFTGDGNLERKPGATEGVTRWAKVGFSTPLTDRARNKLMRVAGSLGLGEPTVRRDGNHLSWSSVELADFFENNGFISGAKNKTVPDWVFDLPESQRLAFVAGLLDSDGCVVAARRRFQIKSCNKALLEQTGRLLSWLGVNSRVYTEFDEPREVIIAGRASTASASHRLEFAVDARLLPFLSGRLRSQASTVAPPKLVHNRRVGRSQIELASTVGIFDVEVSEPREILPTWDIEVEGTANFVCEAFIVHNSKVTMKYPAVYLLGPHARGEVLSIAYAGAGQHQDAGGKIIHAAPDTSSAITSKSISKDGGRGGYRGLVRIEEGAKHARSHVICDALILDDHSRSDTYPYIEIEEESSAVSHEATVSKVSDEQLFYLMSRGLDETQAMQMIVRGFIEPITKELPMEYAVELQRLVELQMEGSVG